MNKSSVFGTGPLGKLLLGQSVPAAIGILVMSIYGIVDTIFVGRYVGPLAIGAVTVVLPITFLISSIGMAIGVGGASIISRAFGREDEDKAFRTFGHQVMLTMGLGLLLTGLGYFFQTEVLRLFGGKGEVYAPAEEFFSVIVWSLPCLAWAMMSNNVIRAEGYPRMAMLTMIIPAVVNVALDYVLIVEYGMGLTGAALATAVSYCASAAYTLWFFVLGKSALKLTPGCFRFRWNIAREIASIGSVTLARQGTISVLSIILNNALFRFGGELSLSAYGIISRVLMFANFPVLGITQGFVPVVGYNYGANLLERVKRLISISIRAATLIALSIFALIMFFTPSIVRMFTDSAELIELTVPALRLVFLATPLLAINLIGSAYFQAIGKALPALLLTLTKQGFFLIPLILIAPPIFGVDAIWLAFPVADLGAAIVTFIYLRREMDRQPVPS